MTLPLIPVSGTFETLVEKVRTTAFAGCKLPCVPVPLKHVTATTAEAV